MNLTAEAAAALDNATNTLRPDTANRLNTAINNLDIDVRTYTAPEFFHEDAVFVAEVRTNWIHGEYLTIRIVNGAWSIRYQKRTGLRSRNMTIKELEARAN